MKPFIRIGWIGLRLIDTFNHLSFAFGMIADKWQGILLDLGLTLASLWAY